MNSLVAGKRLNVAVLLFKYGNVYVLEGLTEGDKEIRRKEKMSGV